MNNSIKEPLNLIEIINTMPDELLKLNKSGANAATLAYKLNAINEYQSMHEINAKSRLWKAFTHLEMESPLITAGSPEIGDLKNEPELEKWSGILEITESRISVYLEEKLSAAGVIFKDIVSALGNHSYITEKKPEYPQNKLDNKLTELVKSTANHGFFLEIPEGLKIDKPFKIRVSPVGTASIFPLNFVTHLKDNCAAKVVLEFISPENGSKNCFIPILHRCEIGTSSELELAERQAAGSLVYLLSNESIQAGENAAVNCFIMDKGSQVTQRLFAINLSQKGANALVTGVYFPDGNQRFVYDTYQNHTASETTSNLLFKGVLDGSADVLWKGNIFVKEGTHGADGYQLNNTLLLSPNTHAESIPGLEISADDVKCSHGVTISSVDPEQLFYLQSRGIALEESNQLVVEGFIHAAISRIKSNEMQNYMRENLGEAEPVF